MQIAYQLQKIPIPNGEIFIKKAFPTKQIRIQNPNPKVEIRGLRRNSDLAENYVAGGKGAEVAISNLENDAGAEDALS